MATFYLEAGGVSLGEYRGKNVKAVLEELARDVGYRGVDDLTGGLAGVTVELVDTEALIEAVEEQTGLPVSADADGDGVANHDNQSFDTWDDLARVIGYRVWDYLLDPSCE